MSLDRRPISVRFPEEHDTYLEERARRLHVTKSHVLRWLVEAAIRSELEFEVLPERNNKRFQRHVNALV